MHERSDGFLGSRPHGCVLLLGVLKEQREKGGEERVRDRLQGRTNIAANHSNVSRTVSQALVGEGEGERERQTGYGV